MFGKEREFVERDARVEATARVEDLVGWITGIRRTLKIETGVIGKYYAVIAWRGGRILNYRSRLRVACYWQRKITQEVRIAK